MNLNNLTLEGWLEHAPVEQFPGGGRINYPRRYAQTAEYLNENAHAEVNIGAAIRDGGLLTDHGPNHIKTVIQRASELVSADTCNLTPYEVYILLCAIHFHDVGNIFGRKGHEVNSKEILKELGPLATTDAVEQYIIFNIAQAHGGSQKDKLDFLPPKEMILNFPVRVQLLAAILKFADELADDYSRAARMNWRLIPKESQIYHKYAHTLKTVEIDHSGRAVKLHFWLNEEDATQKYGKGTEEVYLLDEIYERTFKTHLERLYSMRFMIPEIRLDSVKVKIEFVEELEKIHEPVGYSLEEKGYPASPPKGIFDICPELKCSGESVKNDIEKERKAVS